MKTAAGRNETLNKVKILIADRDKVASLMLYTYFYNRNMDVDTVEDVTGIVEKVLDKKGGIIIMDYGFDGIRTPALLRVIKKIDRNLKVIFTSGTIKPEELAEIREAGIFFHATKPFNYEELSLAVMQAIKKDGGG